MAEDPEVPGLFRLPPTDPNDSVASVSSVGSAEDCPSDFRSCSANATVWNLKYILIKILPYVNFQLIFLNYYLKNKNLLFQIQLSMR